MKKVTIISCRVVEVFLLIIFISTPATGRIDTSYYPSAASGRIDTSSWLGSSYYPSAAPGDVWWPWYDLYEPMIDREIGFLATRLKFTTLRVFLHTLSYEANRTHQLDSMERFLRITERHGIKPGFTFFDSCWNTDAPGNGTNLTKYQCQPIKGHHNGCWYESPLVSGQTSYERYRPYVEDVTRLFGSDSRVQFLEVYNEPRGPGEDFVFGLRDAAYQWIQALQPTNPVISCWDDNNDTDIVNHHEYDTNFKTGFFPSLYSNITKGSVITEGGSRWYQPPLGSGGDNGSPLSLLNFLEALKLMHQNNAVPYAVSGMLNWVSFVGNDNTRWHWNSPDGSNEPAIPWDGWLFPDGTPVSYTEAAAARRFQTGIDEFLSFQKFFPSPPTVDDGDMFLTISPGTAWSAPLNNGVTAIQDALVEASLWLIEGGAASVIVRSSTIPLAENGLTISREHSIKKYSGHSGLVDSKRWNKDRNKNDNVDSFSSCEFFPIQNNTDVCSGGPVGYRDLSVANAPDPLSACASACCAWSDCTAWIVRNFEGTDENCTNELCCWLKPTCSPGQESPFPGATSQFLKPQPGPPLPDGIDGYNFTLDTNTDLLIVTRQLSGTVTKLGDFNLTSLENGLVRGAWNILRILLVTNVDETLTIKVFFNPMYPETGFTGNPDVDATIIPKTIPPRLVLQDTDPLPSGGLGIACGGSNLRVDYFSALPSSLI